MNCFGSRKKNSYTVNDEVIVSDENRVSGKKIKEEQDGKREADTNGEKTNSTEQLEQDVTNDDIQPKNAQKKDKAADKKKDKKLKKKDIEIAEEADNQEKTDNKKKEKKEKKSKKKDEDVDDDKKKDKKSAKKESDGKSKKGKKEEEKKSKDVSEEQIEESKQQIVTSAIPPAAVEATESKDMDENTVHTETPELGTEPGERTDGTDELNGETNHHLHTETHQVNAETETTEFTTESHRESHTETTNEFEAETQNPTEATGGFDFVAEEFNHRGSEDIDEVPATAEESETTSGHRSSSYRQDRSDDIRCGSSTPPPEEDQDREYEDEDIGLNVDHHRRISSDSDLAEAQATLDE